MTELLPDLPLQDASLLLSSALLVVTTIGVVVARRLNGSATPPLKYGLAALWLLALLRVYSASAYVWADTVREAGLMQVPRVGVVVVLTLALILALALVAFYARRIPKA